MMVTDATAGRLVLDIVISSLYLSETSSWLTLPAAIYLARPTISHFIDMYEYTLPTLSCDLSVCTYIHTTSIDELFEIDANIKGTRGHTLRLKKKQSVRDVRRYIFFTESGEQME